jgi:hypothetical protein
LESRTTNIKKQPLEIVKSSNNTLITSNPEDMFNIIHAQLDVARSLSPLSPLSPLLSSFSPTHSSLSHGREKLPKEHIKEVAFSMLQVLQEVQRQSYDSLSERFRSSSGRRLHPV